MLQYVMLLLGAYDQNLCSKEKSKRALSLSIQPLLPTPLALAALCKISNLSLQNNVFCSNSKLSLMPAQPDAAIHAAAPG